MLVSRRSVSGYSRFLEGAPVTVKSAMQKVVALSVTEAETIAGVQCAQDMMYIKRVVLLIKWLKGSKNPANMFTKNLSGPAFKNCAQTFVRRDKSISDQK